MQSVADFKNGGSKPKVETKGRPAKSVKAKSGKK
jgi:hypothetical protein